MKAVRPEQYQILDAILLDVLTNPSIADTRKFYGTPGSKQVALVSDTAYGVPWPENYHPSVDQFTFCRVSERECSKLELLLKTFDAPDIMWDLVNTPRLLGVRIDKYDLAHKQVGLFEMPVQVTIMNAGGSKNGAVAGGCTLYYTPERQGDNWVCEVEAFQGQ
jgi:hypothetical protein